jgi:hypothetical protein
VNVWDFWGAFSGIKPYRCLVTPQLSLAENRPIHQRGSFFHGGPMKKLLPVFSILFLLGWGLSSRTALAQTAANSSATPIEYVIEDIKGSNVQVKEENSNTWDAAQEGQELETGDEIKVGDNSEVSLTLQSDTQVHLSANSDLVVGQIESSDNGGFLSRLQVLAGTILSDVKKNLLESHSSFEVEAGGVVCGVRGTAFEVSNNNGDVQTTTHEGEVATAMGGETHMVTAGNASSFHQGHFQGLRSLRPEERARFQKWRAFRTQLRTKRLRRIRAIRAGRRKPWVRRHGHSAQLIKRREEIRRRQRPGAWR